MLPLATNSISSETQDDNLLSGSEAQRQGSKTGFLIVNADDWGQDQRTTNKALDCIMMGSVSSVSALVFMEDSNRAADLAREKGIEVGLHLNLVTPFSMCGVNSQLNFHQAQLARFLLAHRFSPVIFHPLLARSFEYVVQAQVDEFRRLYGASPERVDGHHHMHLCANVLWQRLIEPGTIVRRSFTFERGEKSILNRMYRRFVDWNLGRRYRLADCFFSLPPIEPKSRLQRIYSLAKRLTIELETHPVKPEEYQYLASGEIFRQIGNVRIAPPSALLPRTQHIKVTTQ